MPDIIELINVLRDNMKCSNSRYFRAYTNVFNYRFSLLRDSESKLVDVLIRFLKGL